MSKTVQIAIRVDGEELERIDALLEAMQKAPFYTGMLLSRATVARMAAIAGLGLVEDAIKGASEGLP